MKTLISSRGILAALLGLAAMSVAVSLLQAEESAAEATEVAKPKIFLDKSIRIVQYQLKRLSNEQLLLVDRATDDPKYTPVYQAILVRPRMAKALRDEALAGLAALTKSSAVEVLLGAIGEVAADNDPAADDETAGVLADLAALLLAQSAAELSAAAGAIHEATSAESAAVRRAALAALLVVEPTDKLWESAANDASKLADLLASIPLVPDVQKRAPLKDKVLSLLPESQPVEVRRGAVRALAAIPSEKSDVFTALVPLFAVDELRADVVASLLAIPHEQRQAELIPGIIEQMIQHAKTTPLEERTSDAFLDEMQLADDLLARLPATQARGYRDVLGELVVRVVRIRTVLEEMRYDKTFFAAQAGKPVQVILENEDMMPHNFCLVAPGTLREVGMLGSQMQPTNDGNPLQYIPETENLLVPGPMCQPNQRVTITFTAPDEPGEYPYVCTFPNHWFRMYGVMVVTADLAEWQANPSKPADPLGLTREIVQNWKLEDFVDDLAAEKKHDFLAGQGYFLEAGCAKCHKMAGQGGVVGPDLSEVFQRHKGNRLALLTEMLDPSKVVGKDYEVYSVVTVAGRILTGIIKTQDDRSVSLMTNPESCEVEKIARDDIDEIVKTSTSMMPKGLLDRFKKEEILEILAYLEAGGKAGSEVYSQ